MKLIKVMKGENVNDVATNMVVNEEWTQTPPNEPGWYWYWSSNADYAPLPIDVHYNKTSRKCFVAYGQFGIREATDCDKFDGWWLPLKEPPLPNKRIDDFAAHCCFVPITTFGVKPFEVIQEIPVVVRWHRLMCSLGLHKWIWTPCGVWCRWCNKVVGGE